MICVALCGRNTGAHGAPLTVTNRGSCAAQVRVRSGEAPWEHVAPTSKRDPEMVIGTPPAVGQSSAAVAPLLGHPAERTEVTSGAGAAKESE